MLRLHAPFAALVALLAALAHPAPSAQSSRALPVLDPQRVQDQDTMTWADYRPIPGKSWGDPSVPGARVLRVALVAVDFPDQPFVITMPKGSDLFGNPQIEPITREQVPQFYADFWGKPNAHNRGHTIHEYWMEQSRGKVGIPKIDAFGPYRMPRNLFQYGLNEWGQEGACPTGHDCKYRIEPDADALWAGAAGADIKSKYDIVLRIYAGYDETSVWQEFGEMKFNSKEDIPAEWGNPDTTKPRWAPTRYVPWTTWKAAAQQWGLASVRQGENSGTITHEIAHFVFKTGDNNNNPYVQPYRRVGSGPWDIMDRGSFNGPGGPHRRWVVPAAEGASMPAGFMLRNRLRYEWLQGPQVLQITRSGLEASGLALATITARAVDPMPGEVAGISVTLDGAAPQDRTPGCDMNTDPLCAGEPVFNFYSVEVVQRIGNDSFTPDNGVLIAKNKNAEGRSCGYNCFTWVIDANPADIKQVDYRKPDGTPVMRTIADYRQLNDALFHAGLNSGSQYEWKDEANRLHFYVLDRNVHPNGILSYDVAVRGMDGAGPHQRGVAASAPGTLRVTDERAIVQMTVSNTGAPAGGTAAGPHGSDVYRLSVAIEGDGWRADLNNALAALRFGDKGQVPVQVTRASGAAPSARVTLTAVSESDPRRRATATTVLSTR
jgi:M6 family metalloprotease-like protein